jgi:hypothetical protein
LKWIFQVRALKLALNDAAKAKLLKNPNWELPALAVVEGGGCHSGPPSRGERNKLEQELAKRSLLAQSQGVRSAAALYVVFFPCWYKYER